MYLGAELCVSIEDQVFVVCAFRESLAKLTERYDRTVDQPKHESVLITTLDLITRLEGTPLRYLCPCFGD